jgi:hypothetical protein
MANRDLAVLTPDESDWFRALQFPSLSERITSRKLAGEALKNFESAQVTLSTEPIHLQGHLRRLELISCHAV